jgi:hypothetical protein
MKINIALINKAVSVASEVFCESTGNELQAIRDHYGKAYNELNIIAGIAVKMILRIGGIELVSNARMLTPADALVLKAEKVYNDRYAE